MALSQNELTMQDILQLSIQSAPVFLETFTELDGAPFVLEPYQIRFLNDQCAFRIVNKARQIGFSTIIGAEGLHRAVKATLVRQGYEANFVSVNRREASAKIEIVRRLYYSLPEELTAYGIKPLLWNDSEFEITFGKTPYQGSLVSQPASSAIRGGRKDILFDEFAHIRDSKKLYQAAIPAITRGNSRITIISTPLGQSGLFYDIMVDTDGYPEYSRHEVPWWESKAMVKPGLYEEALAMNAPDAHGNIPIRDTMGTIDRVEKFGTDKLLAIFRSFANDHMSFQTEYEAMFVDETESYYTWDLIVDSNDKEQTVWDSWPEKYEPRGWLRSALTSRKSATKRLSQ
jgi:phage FluMu gp28-like protein